jgi:hypothetical protein
VCDPDAGALADWVGGLSIIKTVRGTPARNPVPTS